MSRIGILGAGTWGMALARMLVRIGHEVRVWSAIDREIDELVATHRHRNLRGVNALPAAMALAQKYQASMPIVEAVNAVIHGEKNPKDAVTEQMNRKRKSGFGSSVDYESELLMDEDR